MLTAGDLQYKNIVPVPMKIKAGSLFPSSVNVDVDIAVEGAFQPLRKVGDARAQPIYCVDDKRRAVS
jgi:hypothetical protein